MDVFYALRSISVVTKIYGRWKTFCACALQEFRVSSFAEDRCKATFIFI